MELHTPVGAGGQRVEDLAVEDERAPHGAAARERFGERGVVLAAQVAAEPDEGAFGGQAHGRRIVPRGRGLYNGEPFSRRACGPSHHAIRAGFDLTHHFLVAMPGMGDPKLGGSVVYVAEHGPKGALGLVINRPMELDLQTLFERIDLKLASGGLGASPVFYGRPVQTDRGFVLHQPVGE